MHLLALGATSYIGGNAVKYYSDCGHRVDVVTRNPNRVADMAAWSGVNLIEGDPHAEGFLAALLAEHSYDGAVSYLMGWGESPAEFLVNDTLPQVRLAETLAAGGVPRFVFTSSVAAYGDYRHDMTEVQWQDNVDGYGASKSAIEGFLVAFTRQTEMRINLCRPGIIFGESPVAGIPAGGQPLQDIAAKVRAGELLEYQLNAGAQLIHARDLAKCYLALLESDLNGEVIHTLGRPHIPFAEVAQVAAEVYGLSAKVVETGEGPDSRTPRVFTVEKLEEKLGLVFDPRPQLKPYLQSLKLD